jgi:hypothetical protein
VAKPAPFTVSSSSNGRSRIGVSGAEPEKSRRRLEEMNEDALEQFRQAW